MTESSCWYLVWLAGSSDPFCPIIGGKVIDIGVVGVEGAGGRDGVFEARCCVFDGVLDLARPDDDDDDDDGSVIMMTMMLSTWDRHHHLLTLP